MWLHPYEYVYYNALVGWTGNVQRNYETDYWATAMCEAGTFVSEQSPQTRVVIFTDSVQAQFFMRCSNKTIDVQAGPLR